MTPRKARYLWRDHQRFASSPGCRFASQAAFRSTTAAALRATLMVPYDSDANPDHYASGRWGISRRRHAGTGNATKTWPTALSSRHSHAGVSIDGDRLIAAAASDEARNRLKAVTDAAIAQGVFGAPMFIVENEMFWGKDRLDFVERMVAKPTAH